MTKTNNYDPESNKKPSIFENLKTYALGVLACAYMLAIINTQWFYEGAGVVNSLEKIIC